ncbi:hypothetical protein E2C01_065447 [Portunus trituberculatus]|uniref:Uncharacterized protein n=1 Tax=Portunus trituberculatus TaxID=210409 RepID=A0A5B7HPL6_PORTR|nr:hypothetical protein [Portunus trituberculatus]
MATLLCVTPQCTPLAPEPSTPAIPEPHRHYHLSHSADHVQDMPEFSASASSCTQHSINRRELIAPLPSPAASAQRVKDARETLSYESAC